MKQTLDKNVVKQMIQIQEYMNKKEKLAHHFIADHFRFQVQYWKDEIFFVNYAGGYKTNPENEDFYGNTIASIMNGRIRMETDRYSEKMIHGRTIMESVARKFKMVIVN